MLLRYVETILGTENDYDGHQACLEAGIFAQMKSVEDWKQKQLENKIKEEIIKTLQNLDIKKILKDFEETLMYGAPGRRIVPDDECDICKEQDAQHEAPN